MGGMKWTPEYVQVRFPAEVKELKRKEGKNPEIKPTHSWLNNHGFGGIQNYAARNDLTVDEVLLEECGFNERQRIFPAAPAEVEQEVTTWLKKHETIYGKYKKASIDTIWTHMRRMIEISEEAIGTRNILKPARASTRHGKNLAVKIFNQLNEELTKEESRYNYATTLISFWDYCLEMEIVKINPGEFALDKMGWSYNRESANRAPTIEQVSQLWEATKDPTKKDIKNKDNSALIDLLQEKIILILYAGCGSRTDDASDINPHEDIITDKSDPRLQLGKERKNGSSDVPIMAGLDYLELYINLLDEEGYNRLFPSEVSDNESKSNNWIRNKLADVVERAEIRLDDGTKPTPRDLRRFWMNEYFAAYQAFHRSADVVSDAQGSKSTDIVIQHYLDNHHFRDHFQEFAEAHFSMAFPSEEVVTYQDIVEARKDGESISQVRLSDFVHSSAYGGVPFLIRVFVSRLQREKEAVKYDHRVTAPSAHEAVVGIACLALSTIAYILFFIYTRTNLLADPTSGHLGLYLGLLFGLIFIIYNVPDLEHPSESESIL